VAKPRLTVTALREERSGRVRVELDGAPWRTFAADVVVRAGLMQGQELDRSRLRELARERRRSEALRVATRALRHRDHSAAALDAKLERAGASVSARAAALGSLERAGLVDDGRFAQARARALAERHTGDEGIRFELERQGVPPEAIEAAIGALEPESERAHRVAAARGRDPKTARYLARKGFSEESIEPAIGAPVADDT
jgi:SOS response regulatory protein OraA/RecX